LLLPTKLAFRNGKRRKQTRGLRKLSKISIIRFFLSILNRTRHFNDLQRQNIHNNCRFTTTSSSSSSSPSERNLPLYRDALSKVPRLVYVRNLDGGEYICPDLGEVDRSSGERCCKGSTDWLKHPTGTCLCDAFSNSNW
jgi:hypothetical protein